MSQVIIAFYNQTWWLVRGEIHLHDMLAAREPADLEITLVTCEKWPEVLQMWEQPEFGKMPWAINPKIIDRLKTRERTTTG